MLARSGLLNKYFSVPVGGGVNEINITLEAGTIVPAPGDEILVNPGFEGTYDDESGAGEGTVNIAPDWTALGIPTDGTATADKEVTTVHGGSASQYLVAPSTAGFRSAVNAFALHTWYQMSAWIYRVSGSVFIRPRWWSSLITPSFEPSANEWIRISWTVYTGYTESTSRHFVASGRGASEFYVDDGSLKSVTVENMSLYLGDQPRLATVYTCHPTVEEYTQAGLLIRYLDANNYVFAYVDRVTDTAALYKRVGGTNTELRSGAITYSSDAPLVVSADADGNYQLSYDDVDIGEPIAIADNLGNGVYAFTPHSANALGVVTTRPKVG